jgi:capsid protein
MSNFITKLFEDKQLQGEVQTLRSELGAQKKLTAMMVNFGGTSILYDGEKTPNELGTPFDFELSYYRIRKRAWESFIKSTVIQTAIKNYCLWIVGSGLKFQSEPNLEFLKIKGINIGDDRIFTTNIEAQFRLFANSKECTYTKEMNLHALACEALKNAILAGDVLVILRYEGYQPTIQIIDGCFVSNPVNFGIEAEIKARGNYLISGVEITPSGEHVAYYVQENDMTSHARIEANPSGAQGERQAWLMVGQRHKIMDTRGMSLLTAVMERDAKLDRYLEASVGAAEESAKIPYTFETDVNGIAGNPQLQQIAQGLGVVKTVENETAGKTEQYASKIAMTTQKQVYVLDPGQTLKTNTAHSDPQFNSFFTPNAELIFATIGIPPEVAMGKFGGSYSGSRAAIKSWEYKMKVERTSTMTEMFYKPIYQFWFLINFYKGNIKAQGFREAKMSGDWMVANAYTSCRFIGVNVPHIDPVKEVDAERRKLGTQYDTIPLTTGESAVENLGMGDFTEITKNSEKELSQVIVKKEADV